MSLSPEVRKLINETLPRIVRDAQARARDRARTEGTNFCAADYAIRDDVGNREVRLNPLIANFLDPNGTHGQGTRFLRLFLRYINIDSENGDLRDWYAKVDYPIATRENLGGLVDIALINKALGVSARVYIECM